MGSAVKTSKKYSRVYVRTYVRMCVSSVAGCANLVVVLEQAHPRPDGEHSNESVGGVTDTNVRSNVHVAAHNKHYVRTTCTYVYTYVLAKATHTYVRR